MRRFAVNFFVIMGVIASLFLFAAGWFLYHLTSSAMPRLTGDSAVLSLALGDESLVEQPASGGLRALIEGRPLSVHAVIEGISRAAKDENIKGILLNVEGSSLEMATTQEIREAFKSFKASGKFIYAYADTFGELSNGAKGYYLAAAATEIWVMPLGQLNFNGMIAEVPFIKKALDDFKIHPQIGRREEYKGAPESLTESDFTLPHRENKQRLLDGLTTQIVGDVAADRGLEAGRVREMLDTSPHALQHALDAKMIDKIGYKDQVKDAIEKRLGKKPTYYDFDLYAQNLKDASKGDKIAVIYAEGTIAKGRIVRNPLTDDAVMDAVEIARSIREAGEDDSIKAIVFRIDSGGGDAIASALIGREVERLKSKKPVIVSMSNYAASGGYWIASNARKIVAQPASITGSIGVYAGKITTQDFWESLGVHWGEIHNGANASIWSTGQDYSDIGRQKLNDYLDQIYAAFQEKVVKGRNLDAEKVRQIAKGQVWTGAEAKENGLVDALGGLTTAIDIAKKEAGIAAYAPISLVRLPAPKSALEFLLNRNQNETSVFSAILSRYPAVRMIGKQWDGLFAPPQINMEMAP